jgi:hypothetical protein
VVPEGKYDAGSVGNTAGKEQQQAVGPVLPYEIKQPRGGSHECNILHWSGHSIAYCIKRIDGVFVQQRTVAAERKVLSKWLAELPGPWYGAMEATIFTGWVYDFLKPHVVELKVAHPAMLKAITAAKKKNDKADAEKIADLLRVNLLPESGRGDAA